MRIWLFLVKESGFVMVCPEMRDKTWEKTMANVVLNHRVWVYPFFDKPLYIYIYYVFPTSTAGWKHWKRVCWGVVVVIFVSHSFTLTIFDLGIWGLPCTHGMAVVIPRWSRTSCWAKCAAWLFRQMSLPTLALSKTAPVRFSVVGRGLGSHFPVSLWI